MPGPHPAVAEVRRAVAAALADVPDGALVLVACSGGPDSLALAAATAFVARARGRTRWRAGAVLVDHGLQPGSAAVAARAAAACRDLGLDPVEVVAVTPAGPGGPEAAARAARYAALADAADRHGAAAVLLGHTRDDQAEGVLLGLARGSGGRSLAGMAPVRGPFRRPLLGVPRERTVAACAALGLDPWHDPTNTPAAGDDAPLRSRLRTRVLPVLEREAGPGVAAALARTAELLREDADALDALAGDLLDRALAGPAADPADPADAAGHPATVLLDVAALADAPAALRNRALRAAAVRAGAPAAALAREHVLALAALVVAWRGQGPLHLPGHVEASRACGRLALRAGAPDRGDAPRGVRADGAGPGGTNRGDRHR